jgi:hypothetical protein
MKLVTVGEAHEIAVSRGLEVQAPKPDFESSWEGIRATQGVSLDVISMRIIIDTVGGELISARLPYLARQLSVRKVVVTLTSRFTEIDLSMAGAKQQWDTRFIMVPTVSRTSSRGALVVLYCKALSCS